MPAPTLPVVRNMTDLPPGAAELVVLHEQTFQSALNLAIWFGRSAAQVLYRGWTRDGRIGLRPAGYVPVDGDKLVFKWGGQVGVRVNGTYHDRGTELTNVGMAHFFDADDRQALVVHQHRPEDASFFRPQKGGAIFGVGLRERLYWFWSLKNLVMGLLTDYLRWFAQGLTVYFYEMGNAQAHAEVKRRVEEGLGKPFLLFPREPHTGDPKFPPFERFDPSGASTNLMQALVTGYFDSVIRRMTLGQSLTTTTGATGLGSGVAEAHADTFAGVSKYDATGLQDTLTADYLGVLYAWTWPGVAPGRWVFEIDSPAGWRGDGDARVDGADHSADLLPADGSEILIALDPAARVATLRLVVPPPDAAPGWGRRWLAGRAAAWRAAGYRATWVWKVAGDHTGRRRMAPGRPWTGYYVWPRLGFDARMSRRQGSGCRPRTESRPDGCTTCSPSPAAPTPGAPGAASCTTSPSTSTPPVPITDSSRALLTRYSPPQPANHPPGVHFVPDGHQTTVYADGHAHAVPTAVAAHVAKAEGHPGAAHLGRLIKSPYRFAAGGTTAADRVRWANFGPHSYLPVIERPYAEQKATVLPKPATPRLPDQLARPGFADAVRGVLSSDQ